MSYAFEALAPEFSRLWRDMRVSEAKRALFDKVARRLYSARDRYAAVTAATGVPMCVLAVIHEREASGNFARYLGNGQPLSQVTTIVPKGRGPFASWEAGAIDAIRLEGIDKVRHWTIERALFVIEPFNGYGYRKRGLRSPYLWAGTNLQQPGKYVRDGVFDPGVMDPQLGCAGLLAALWALDPAWRLSMEGQALPPAPIPAPVPAPAPKPPAPPRPPVTPPKPRPRPPQPPMTPTQQGGIAAAIAALVGAIAMAGQQIADWLHAHLPFLF